MKTRGPPGQASRLETQSSLSGLAGMLLVGPLRGLFEASPSVLYGGAIFLFIVPGLVAAVLWTVSPAVVASANVVDRSAENALSPRSDPILRGIRNNVDEPGVLLVPDGESTCTPPTPPRLTW